MQFAWQRRQHRFAALPLQQIEESLHRHRRTNQHALAEIAAHHLERVQIGTALNPFRDDRAAESVRKVDHCLTNPGMRRIGRTVLDDPDIELELSKTDAVIA